MLLFLACHKEPPPAPVSVVTEPTPAASPQREAVVRALSVREGAPDCAEVEGLSTDPVATLLDVVATVRMPPTAPMRAAACLLDRHPAEVEGTILAWMADPEARGLAMLAISRIDSLPSPLAIHVAQAALSGPHAALVREQVAASAQPEVRGLATP